ncbi:hypothetical protein KSP40_PGU021041 [Platanthera guangdongensis]|uniref:Uncharacterized protein n=1 Tax=Platanthera guangdongensis TaxID=2320717 RepID=A0ABR2LHZ1_9ASPA
MSSFLYGGECILSLFGGGLPSSSTTSGCGLYLLPVEIEPVLVKEVKKTDGATSLELRVSAKNRVRQGFWNFLDKFGFHHGENPFQSLHPLEICKIQVPVVFPKTAAHPSCCPTTASSFHSHPPSANHHQPPHNQIYPPTTRIHLYTAVSTFLQPDLASHSQIQSNQPLFPLRIVSTAPCFTRSLHLEQPPCAELLFAVRNFNSNY